jgi:transcriptional regulator GlxA family with amidase domain
MCAAPRFRAILPPPIHVCIASVGHSDGLAATVAQIVTEVDVPQQGGGSVLERLTEAAILKLLLRLFQIGANRPTGWPAAISDPAVGRCLALLHRRPRQDWSLAGLAVHCGLFHSALPQWFETLLGTAPIRYLRDWRLYLASVDLGTTTIPIASIADAAGYGTEAAFSRAFSRSYGTPPAEWRRQSQVNKK